MTRRAWKAWLLIALPAIGCSGVAERPQESPAAPEPRLTLEVQDADLRVLVDRLHGDVPATLAVDPEVRERVSIHLVDVHWRDAIEAIARKAHCILVEERAHNVFRFIQPPSGGIEFRDADLRVAIRLLAKCAGIDVVVSSEVQGTVKLTVRRPAAEAAPVLQRLVDENGLAMTRDATECGEVVRIVRARRSDEDAVDVPRE